MCRAASCRTTASPCPTNCATTTSRSGSSARTSSRRICRRPRQRHPYFITSFEKVPGTPVGNGLTDLLADLQESANATLRSLINNLSISSGPQVVINDDMLAPEENGEDMYPWKRWHTRNDPMTAAASSRSVLQPANNAQQLIAGLPGIRRASRTTCRRSRSMSVAGGGGAGRTASGLAMLMGNASKILQTVSANIDRDVIEESDAAAAGPAPAHRHQSACSPARRRSPCRASTSRSSARPCASARSSS
jgi:hypothetical protein